MKEKVETALKRVSEMKTLCAKLLQDLQVLELHLQTLSKSTKSLTTPDTVALPAYRYGPKVDVHSDLTGIPIESILPLPEFLDKGGRYARTKMIGVLRRSFEVETVADLMSEKAAKIDRLYNSPDKVAMGRDSVFHRPRISVSRGGFGVKSMVMLVLSCRYHGLPVKLKW